MSGSSGAKKQKTDVDEQFFDRLDGKDGLIKLILSYLTREDGYEYVKYLKEGLFKPKNDDTEKAIQEKKDFMNSLDTFLAKCTRLYLLIERYKEEFPRGTPFVCACQRGRMDDVESFVNLHDFHKYISNSNNGNMALKDMVNHVGSNSRGYERTPLMTAANREHFQVVQYLIEQGADPTITDSAGWNALHYAARWNITNTELIELLLTHMSLDSINKKSRGGETPLDLAYRNWSNLVIRQEIIALLRSNGGKTNYYDDDGNYIDSSSDEEDANNVNMDEQGNQLLKF